jgi:hypothetical protein
MLMAVLFSGCSGPRWSQKKTVKIMTKAASAKVGPTSWRLMPHTSICSRILFLTTSPSFPHQFYTIKPWKKPGFYGYYLNRLKKRNRASLGRLARQKRATT